MNTHLVPKHVSMIYIPFPRSWRCYSLLDDEVIEIKTVEKDYNKTMWVIPTQFTMQEDSLHI